MHRCITVVVAIGCFGLLAWASAFAQAGPGAFSRSSPTNGATEESERVDLNWNVSPGAVSYEYCYDATNDDACTAWVSTGGVSSVVLSGLAPGTTYYWHARANNAFGTTYANGGAFWTFATQAAPGPFTKAAPIDGATGLPFSVTLSWNPSTGGGAINYYEYCYDTINDNSCTNWGSVGGTSTSIFNLSADTTYYWQVRAFNPAARTYADANASAFWSFRTGAPGSFGKSQPLNGQSGVALTTDIAWGQSGGLPGYEYCYDTTNDGTCANWIATNIPFASLVGLSPSTTYYWHVRAVAPYNVTYADGDASAFWSFTTKQVLPPPACNVLFLLGANRSASTASTVFPISGAPASFTTEAWILPAQPPLNHRFQTIVSDDGYTLFLEEFVAGSLRIGVALPPHGSPDSPSAFYDNRTVTQSDWHHVAFVYDDATKQGRISLDGVLGPPFPISNIDFAPSGRTLTLGAFDNSFHAHMLVDNVRISSIARYVTAFTPSNSFVNDAHTRALYQFGGTPYINVFPDESGNGHTLTGSAQSWLAGLCIDPSAPTVTGIVPSSGPTTGGTVVGITGTGFTPGLSVSFGGTPAASVAYHNTTSITATTGARSAGVVSVLVTNPDANVGTLVNGFTYVTPQPGAFGRMSPSHAAMGVTAKVLSGGASSWATSYEYCIDTTNDNACTAWTSTGPSTSAAAVGLASYTTYYWHVRALNESGTAYADTSAAPFWTFTTGAVTPLPNFRDFNADGKPDIVWEHPSEARYVWFLDGTTLSSGAFVVPTPVNAVRAVVGVNDFTGDGKPDLLMQSSIDGTVILHRMDGVNHVASQTIQAAQNTPWKVVASGDFNGDGKPDIVWQNFSTGQIYIWFMSSSGGAAVYGGVGGIFDGGFVRDGASNIASVGAVTMRVVGADDLDLDGDTDLVWQDQTTGALRVWYLNGHVLTASASISPATVNPDWKIKAVGDYNADGKADFVFQHTTGWLYVWFMNGSTFSSGAYMTPAAVNPVWKLVGPR